MYKTLGVLCKALAVMSVLSSMDRSVEWDCQPMILLCSIHNVARLAFDHTQRFTLYERVTVLSVRMHFTWGEIALPSLSFSPIHDQKFHRRFSQ